MAFYVPLGFRGICFQVGTLLITVFGGVVYWRASRRRTLSIVPVILNFDLGEGDLLPIGD
ncbi:hypothetical protein [Singulisphaera sp. PoT]|uniref:hypothetical protein n=1 Tax=Singulisphaera sp. PoT TaxID=3411797 RepID=UPI003BF61611